MPTRRTKTLSIRISEDEYETLKAFYSSSGNRSVSAVTREALRRLVQNRVDPESDVETALRSLDQRLGVLQGTVSSLSRTVAERLLGETKG
jgi:Arc/MetJ-type ribon-helix-helix transcriptional regulator